MSSNLTNRFAQPFLHHFPGDETLNPMQRQTPNEMYAYVNTIGFPEAKLIHSNDSLLGLFGLNPNNNHDLINLLNANPPDSIQTYATAYAGHQFGNWAGQLGDGRAIYLGEIIDQQNNSWEWQYKGAGATPYSRRGDGRAVLRSTIREYLMSEAMYHLGVPTTRSVSMSLSGENVMRDLLYNGNPAYEKGAVMVRAAESFLRFGHFEFLNAHGHDNLIQKLADYTIRKYFPLLQSEGKAKYLQFFEQIQARTIDLIIDWYRVGFVHGVMNTDNMSILGLTIDYGPFAMLDAYNLSFTSNTTDLPGKRYAFGKQGSVALWNLNALANALYPIIQDADALQQILSQFEKIFWSKFDQMMSFKLGLDSLRSEDTILITECQKIMTKLELDYTLFFNQLKYLHIDSSYQMDLASISYKDLTQNDGIDFNKFINLYKERISKNEITAEQSFDSMGRTNPTFILRNYMLYEATQKAEQGDFELIGKLWEALQSPYNNHFPEYIKKRPDWAESVPGCSMLSCSS